MVYAKAVPARFDGDPRRRAMLAKVHIAPKQLGMDDESYRALLRRVTGQITARDCDNRQLEALIAEFTRLGFRAVASPRRAGRPKPADHPVARKARAMWISLGLLCAVRHPEEPALEAFARRQLGCERFQWANQSQADRIIEALKAMAERHGWQQSLAGLSREHHVHALKARLCDAILAKLHREAIVPTDWKLGKAAWELCGIGDPGEYLFETDEFDAMARGLGSILREQGGEDAFREIGR